MIVRPGSGADIRRKAAQFRKCRDSSIVSGEWKRNFYEEKSIRENNNKEALEYFINSLKKALTDEEYEKISSVIDYWEKRKYKRAAILAYHDVEQLEVVSKEKLDKCQAKLLIYLRLKRG